MYFLDKYHSLATLLERSRLALPHGKHLWNDSQSLVAGRIEVVELVDTFKGEVKLFLKATG